MELKIILWLKASHGIIRLSHTHRDMISIWFWIDNKKIFTFYNIPYLNIYHKVYSLFKYLSLFLQLKPFIPSS